MNMDDGKVRKNTVQIARYLKPEAVRLGMMNGHIDEMDPEKDPTKERIRLKEEVIDELTDLFMQTGKIRNRSKFHHDLLSRERKATTGIGDGLALPHIRSMQPKGFSMVFARSRAGVEYASLDGKPAHIFFGLAAPSYDERLSNEYLLFYKWIARNFKDAEWLPSALLQAVDEHEIISILSSLD